MTARVAAAALAASAAFGAPPGPQPAPAREIRAAELPDYERIPIARLYLATRRLEGPYVAEAKPFLVLGVAEHAPPDGAGAYAEDHGDGAFTLASPLMGCCSVHATVRFRVEPADAGDGPAAPDAGGWVAVFGRLRPAPASADQRPGRRGVIGWSRPRPAPFVIEAERVVPAERVVKSANIADLLDASNLSVFARAVAEAGLVQDLRAAERITVFAPIDQAFDDLDPAQLDALFSADARDALRRFVLRHVARERLSEAALAGAETVTTADHAVRAIDAGAGGLRIDGARLLFQDASAYNGPMHFINAVLPPAPPPPDLRTPEPGTSR